MFHIKTAFPIGIDAVAASDALHEKLGTLRQAADFAASCGLVKVVWDKIKGEAKLIGDDKARKIGYDALAEIGRGAKIETVRCDLLNREYMVGFKELLWPVTCVVLFKYIDFAVVGAGVAELARRAPFSQPFRLRRCSWRPSALSSARCH